MVVHYDRATGYRWIAHQRPTPKPAREVFSVDIVKAAQVAVLLTLALYWLVG